MRKGGDGWVSGMKKNKKKKMKKSINKKRTCENNIDLYIHKCM